jgi:porphobilinogen synthase
MTYPLHQPRRLRRTEGLRSLVQETRLSPAELIYPLFIIPGQKQQQEITAMPGQYLYSIDRLAPVIEQLQKQGVNTVLLFGQTDVKDSHGHAAYADTNVILAAIKILKKLNPQLTIITDVCLCSYTEHGHCGPLKNFRQQKLMDNAATLEILAKTALVHAEAGADIVAPSGMVDGMVAKIRDTLDTHQHDQVAILSYAVKYASNFYGPFREAADSAPQEGDRRNYQMNPANKKEALLEAALDVEEGADLLMVKPGLPYLDIISELNANFDVPVFAYQVSGEYSMIKAAAERGWIDEKKVALESLLAMKRAGARAIISYFALSVDMSVS